MARNKEDDLVPIVMQQAILHSASASLHDVGDDESTGRRLAYTLRTVDVGDDQTMTMMTATPSCCPLMLQHPLVRLSLVGPWGHNS